jgi:formate-dependent phosphoribosylglycinamide formyltransferase (GAR transformylase)
MPNVLFLSPGWPPEMPSYVRGLAAVGARVIGVGDSAPQSLPEATRRALAAYVQVPAIMDEDDVIARLERELPGRPDRVEALWEPVMILAARLRERWGLPGMSVDTVEGFRDKPLMKERVAAAGLRVPLSFRASNADSVRAAVAKVGFPAILKPVAGAGSADTFRVDDARDLEGVLARIAHVPEVAVEEFVRGPEYTYETLSIGGRPVLRSVCRYWPNTLEARQQEWISPIIHTFRHPPAEAAGGIALGDGVLKALGMGMGTGLSHMEWFHTPEGEAVFGEVACRPPGANMVDLMNYAGDVDLFKEWARAVVHGRVELPKARPWSAAIVFKRAQGQGRIHRIDGVRRFVERYGRWIARLDLLPIGHPRRDWKATFLSDGNLVLRHPDADTALAMAREAASSIQMYAR